MRTKSYTLIALLVALTMVTAACGQAATPAPTVAPPTAEPTKAALAAEPTKAPTAAPTKAPTATPKPEPVTIVVWDYYGAEVSPLKPIIAAFQAAYPNITVKREDIDWDTLHTKLNVVLTSGNPPDVATVDMTWLPKFAALGAFADLNALSGGKLNGVPFEKAYTKGAYDAMNYKGKIVTAMYDFDVYALYYRTDLLEQNGLQPPKTWEELVQVGKKIAGRSKNLYAFSEDTFHGSQFIYENGGTLMNADNTAAAFNSPEAVQAIQFYADLVLKEKIALDWTSDQGEIIQGAKDGRIAMWSDGPFRMAQLKTAAPELSGKWRIALHPYSKQPGSYLGGTGLSIPANAPHQEAAWKFIEFALRVDNAIGIYKYAGAAPALTAALESPEVNVPDPYFGNQKTMEVFLETMKTAHPFPYIRQWDDIDVAFSEALKAIVNKQMTAQKAMDDAAATANDLLKK